MYKVKAHIFGLEGRTNVILWELNGLSLGHFNRSFPRASTTIQNKMSWWRHGDTGQVEKLQQRPPPSLRNPSSSNPAQPDWWKPSGEPTQQAALDRDYNQTEDTSNMRIGDWLHLKGDPAVDVVTCRVPMSTRLSLCSGNNNKVLFFWSLCSLADTLTSYYFVYDSVRQIMITLRCNVIIQVSLKVNRK